MITKENKLTAWIASAETPKHNGIWAAGIYVLFKNKYYRFTIDGKTRDMNSRGASSISLFNATAVIMNKLVPEFNPSCVEIHTFNQNLVKWGNKEIKAHLPYTIEFLDFMEKQMIPVKFCRRTHSEIPSSIEMINAKSLAKRRIKELTKI